MAGHVARTGEIGKCIQNVGRKNELKRPRERPRRRWDDNTGMNLIEIG